jgi:hypothetical protein
MEELQLQSAFVSFFRPNIRVLFDWSRFLHERWPIELHVVTERKQIEDWYLPWNVDSQGREVDFSAPAARPIQLKELRDIKIKLRAERRTGITKMVRLVNGLSVNAHPYQLALPTYRIPNGLHFVLDGNHRLASLFLARLKFNILTFTVAGPLHRSILPELRHWENDLPNVQSLGSPSAP